MSRFVIHWSGSEWYVVDKRDLSVAATFDSLLEAETYVIERSKRVER